MKRLAAAFAGVVLALVASPAFAADPTPAPPIPVVALAPTFTEPKCGGDRDFTLPEVVGLTYRVDDSYSKDDALTLTVTVEAKDGYVIEGDDGPWSETYPSPASCEPKPEPKPTTPPKAELPNAGVEESNEAFLIAGIGLLTVGGLLLCVKREPRQWSGKHAR